MPLTVDDGLRGRNFFDLLARGDNGPTHTNPGYQTEHCIRDIHAGLVSVRPFMDAKFPIVSRHSMPRVPWHGRNVPAPDPSTRSARYAAHRARRSAMLPRASTQTRSHRALSWRLEPGPTPSCAAARVH